MPRTRITAVGAARAAAAAAAAEAAWGGIHHTATATLPTLQGPPGLLPSLLLRKLLQRLRLQEEARAAAENRTLDNHMTWVLMGWEVPSLCGFVFIFHCNLTYLPWVAVSFAVSQMATLRLRQRAAHQEQTRIQAITVLQA
eukprot:RCo031681